MNSNQYTRWWICGALAWWLISLVAWLRVWLGELQLTAQPSTLTCVSLLAVAVAATLRGRFLTNFDRHSSSLRCLVWWLAIGSMVNWLGAICLSSSSLVDCVPAFFIVVAAEWLITDRISCGAVRTNAWIGAKEHGATVVDDELSSRAVYSSPPSGHGSNVDVDSAPSSGDGSDQVEPGCTVRRVAEDGIDADGQRYVSGEAFLEWSHQQDSQVVVVGFVPAFESIPDIQFEIEPAEFSGRCLAVTVSGMRVLVKRISPSTYENCTLTWYALEIGREQANQQSEISRLPLA
ncbi:MAG: hypothetical protein KF752_06995 [Pirellulaceae bacterium]|nr:hypothetical protein [Pirellulaceae bacterium]